MGLRADAQSARDQLIDAARAAGEIALGYFRAGEATSARVEYKAGGSPVTEADIAVDAFLRTRLEATFAGAGWLSEESEDDLSRLAQTSLLVVDPIDGTRAFLTGDPRWAVSIALVVDGPPDRRRRPRARASAKPMRPRMGAERRSTKRRSSPRARSTLRSARIAGPKPMVEAIARAAGVSLLPQPNIPSLAYRMALVGERRARSRRWLRKSRMTGTSPPPTSY